jgi:hypothetical protein
VSNPFLPLLPSSYPGDDWNIPPPMLPQPSLQAELIPATAPANAVLPDEQAGEAIPYPFAMTPLPELTYNPNPAMEPSLADIASKKV